MLLFVEPKFLQSFLQGVVLRLKHALQVLVTQNGITASFEQKIMKMKSNF